MKLTIIHGSPRKGNTYTAVQTALQEMRLHGEVEAREFFLPDDLPFFCMGCMACFEKGEEACPHAQYTIPLRDAMNDADALILTTPVYALRESGAVKAFLDHFAFQFIVHRPRLSMFGKKALIVCTTAGGGTQKSMEALKTSLTYWGVNRVYTLGMALHAGKWADMEDGKRTRFERKIRRCASAFYKDVHGGKRHIPYPILYIMYPFARAMLSGKLFKMPEDSLDRRYWEEKGLLQRRPF